MVKNKISEYFGIPMGETRTDLYLASMNESGKITARSILELIMIIVDEIDELQNKEPELSNYEILNPSRKKK